MTMTKLTPNKLIVHTKYFLVCLKVLSQIERMCEDNQTFFVGTTIEGFPISQGLNINVSNYDNLGNPNNYRGNNATWGRVGDLTRHGDNFYRCDGFGIRTQKSRTGDTLPTHIYYTEGAVIHREDRLGAGIAGGVSRLVYHYDATGVCGFEATKVDGNVDNYWFVKNVFGDVIALVDGSNKVVVRYAYDAFGNCTVIDTNPIAGDHTICGELTITGFQGINTDPNFIGNLNPWRWRGQYFDTDSGFYMMPSNGITRYYDPRVGIIINATLDEAFTTGSYAFGFTNPFAVFGNTFSQPTWGYAPVYIPDIPEDSPANSSWAWWQWVILAVMIVVVIALIVASVFTAVQLRG